VAVVVADQRMPEMTGSELMKSVRDQFPNAVRILMTGYSDMNALVDSVNQGEIFRYVSKPWEIKMLMETIRLAVEKNRQNIIYEKLLSHNKSLLERNQKVAERLNQTIEELNKVQDDLRDLNGSQR
jgi:response regulator RpfG family c-di-GMP phosphodiesterase